jgi:hypothetical protein
LAAAELFLRRKSDDPESGEAIRAVHAVTELWSLGYAWRATGLERTKRVLILQSAGWVAELRDALLDRDAISMEGPGIASLGAGEETTPSSLDELFEHNQPAAGRGYFDRYPESASKYVARLRFEVASKALEYHQLKYAVAIEDESRNSSPRWASRLLAPALGYMPTDADRQTDLTERALAALRKAQVI